MLMIYGVEEKFRGGYYDYCLRETVWNFLKVNQSIYIQTNLTPELANKLFYQSRRNVG